MPLSQLRNLYPLNQYPTLSGAGARDRDRAGVTTRSRDFRTVDMRLTDNLVDLIEEGVDIAIRVGALEDSRLISRRLGPNRACAYTSPAYLAARGTPRSLEDLIDHDRP